MKQLVKSSRIVSIVLALVLLLAQTSISSVYAQAVNSEHPDAWKLCSKEADDVDKTEWHPYSETDSFEDVFDLEHSDYRTISASEINAHSADEILASFSARCSDQYGKTGWPSLGAAQAYYGLDFSYFSIIPFVYKGGLYTHYYTFSDGSRMYFGVK